MLYSLHISRQNYLQILTVSIDMISSGTCGFVIKMRNNKEVLIERVASDDFYSDGVLLMRASSYSSGV